MLTRGQCCRHRWDPVVKEWLQKSDEELAEDRREKEAADREKEAREKQEKERKEEAKRKQEMKDQKKIQEQERKDGEKAEKEKQKADKQSEIRRLMVQQHLMKGKSVPKVVEQPKAEDGGNKNGRRNPGAEGKPP